MNAICLVYSNAPESLPSTHNATDIINTPDAFYSLLSAEGFGYGRVDKNGYHNSAEMAECQSPDILIMGSSHMKGAQMPQEKIAACVLHELLDDMSVYNTGMSRHFFLKCTANLRSALEWAKPTKYVIIETLRLPHGSEELQQAISDTIPKFPPGREKLRYLPGNMPYVNLIYSRLVKSRLPQDEDALRRSPPAPDNELMARLLDKTARLARENNVALIIVYHTQLRLDASGSVTVATRPDDVRNFADACSAAGITFVDMTDIFLTAYAEEHVLPYGFANTRIGRGHLNADGHRMVAQELARVIRDMERSRTAREAVNLNMGDKQ